MKTLGKLFAGVMSFVLLAGTPVLAAEGVWLEGESFTSASKLKPSDGLEELAGSGKGYEVKGWGNTRVMSEGRVLSIDLAPAQVDGFVPEDGLSFTYGFNLDKAGRQRIWARIGYEWVRSDFQWRVDREEWHTCSNAEPTINIQPIAKWCELAWLELGSLDLAAGAHSIEFRHVPYKFERKGKEQTARLLHLLDAVYITPEAFAPAGRWRPGQDHMTDAGREAAKHVFKLNTKPGDDDRAWTVLNGSWQYSAWEETELPIKEDTRLKGVNHLFDLSKLRWFAYTPPAAREDQLPGEAFAHRYLLRTRMDVPAELKGKGFFLDVQYSGMIVSVFVNGKYMGYTDTFHTAWQMDLTRGIAPGKVNELVLCVKDAYYSLNPKDDESAETLGNRWYWNIPPGLVHANLRIGSRHDMPVAADPRSGIMEPASIVVTGPVYTDDVFCQPSVKNKQLKLDVTVMNPRRQEATVTVENRVIPWNDGKGGAAELQLPAKELTVPAGEAASFQIREEWANPRLWWPDNPYLYWVVTTVKQDGKTIDSKKTRFGFREWDWSTDQFKINGVKWTMWADLNANMKEPEVQTEAAETTHANQIRYWNSHPNVVKKIGKMTPRRDAMDHFDETGMLVRSSGTFDGELLNYGMGVVEPDKSQQPDGGGRCPSKAKTRLFDNWRKQMTAWIKEERNHPSIYIWSVENEITYINIHNTGQWRLCEPEIAKGVKHAMTVDPTRPAMIDGGNCLHDESLPINGGHYTNGGVEWREYPDAAYTKRYLYETYQRGAWRTVPGRPIVGGELYVAGAAGGSKDSFATVGGEECFIGTVQTTAARDLMARMLSEGYRWCNYGSFQLMLAQSEHQNWNSWKAVAVLCRQWNWTWGADSEVTRTLRVFNTTSRRDPIEVTWQFDVDGKKIAGETRIFNVPRGEAEAFDVRFKTPRVDQRTAGKFSLIARREGREVFRDEKKVALLAPLSMPKAPAMKLAVFDPNGSVKTFLRQRAIAFSEIAEYGKVPADAEVVIVGSDAIPADRTTDDYWLKLASQGRKVVVLDQRFPLAYGALPGDLQPTGFTGRVGFSEDLAHPVFKGLAQDDFFTWGNDHILYRNAYRKGSSGGRSLLQCDNYLKYSALFESQVNDGLLILCQLAMKDKILSEAVAQQVFNNMLNYVAEYKPVRKNTLVFLPADGRKKAVLDEINVEYKPTENALDTLKKDNVAVVEATPVNLKILAESKSRVDEFCRSGGWLMLWGLTPEGLKSYNRLVGHEHLLRPFEMERVLLNQPRDELAAGLTLRDVVMDTGGTLHRRKSLRTPSSDTFSWIVDHDDIAPFCEFPDGLEMGKGQAHPGMDHEPRNMVNGFHSGDHWQVTYTTIPDRGHNCKFTLTLPREEELDTLRILPSRIYDRIVSINVYIDDDPAAIVANLPKQELPDIQEIALGGRKAKKITIEVAEWEEDRNIFVIDNLWLEVKRDPCYLNKAHPLLNIGGLVAYHSGKGGILLNQIRLLDLEKTPDNAQKKASIVRTLLHNMGSTFGCAAGEEGRVKYASEPVRIEDRAFNSYVDHKRTPSWFEGGHLSALPVGDRAFCGVDFWLCDFATSPVPSVFMLAGPGSQTKESVINIKVGRKADALFLLHTGCAGTQITSVWQRAFERALKQRKPLPPNPVLFTYRIHYGDGTRKDVPVVYGKNVSNWLCDKAMPLPGADLAWVGEQESGQKAAVWMMKWVNPHRDKEIRSIDLVSSSNGTAAILAVSTGLSTDTKGGEHMILYRVNCGANRAYTDETGNAWLADQELAEDKEWGAVGGGTASRAVRTIPGTLSPWVYRTERYNIDRYEFKVPEGFYTVRLHFAETFFGNHALGTRVFDVSVNGQERKGFDPLKAANGFCRPTVERFAGIAPRDGRITITLNGGIINGIEIFKHDHAPDVKTKRILFIGNSLTGFWDLPESIAHLVNAGASGFSVETDRAMMFGKNLTDQWERGEAARKIKAGHYDYVVLQGYKNEWWTPEGYEAALELSKSFDNLIKESGAKTLLYCTWPWACPVSEAAEEQKRITAGYYRVAEDLGARVIPVAPAWQAAREQDRGLDIQLYADYAHPTLYGAYLSACVYFAALTGESPVGHPVAAIGRQLQPIESEIATFLQRIAWETVREHAGGEAVFDVPVSKGK